MYHKKDHTYISRKLLNFDTSDMEQLREWCRIASFQLRDAAHALERIENELDVSREKGITPRRPVLRRLAANAGADLCWEDEDDPVVAARLAAEAKKARQTFCPMFNLNPQE